MTGIVEEIFQSLGISRTYYGYSQAVCAIELALEDETRLCNITKEIYWKVADSCGCNHADIERNIRTIISRAWQKNPELLSKMARYPLHAPPTVSEFIDIVCTCVQRQTLHSLQ